MKSKRGRRGKSGTKIGLRISRPAADALAEIAARTGASKTRVLERALLAARADGGGR